MLQVATKEKQKVPLSGCVILALASILVFALVSSSVGATSSASRDELMAAQEALLLTEMTLAGHRETIAEERRVEVAYHTGMDVRRVERDNQLALTYFTPAFSWRSGAEYDAARAVFVADLGEVHPFIRVFMPPNGSIDRFNYIDLNNLNSDLISFDSYVTGIRGEIYMYTTIVTMAATGHLRNTGALGPLSGQGFATVILMYTVDGRGVIGNISAWPTF